MARKWVERVSINPRFLFTAKLRQVFTHDEELTAENEREFRPGMEALRDAGKLGALLAQFPWSFKYVPESRDYLTQLTARFKDFPLVIEVRHSSWNDSTFYEWLSVHGVGFCNIDQPLIGRSLKPSERVTAPVGYLRLHGRNYKEWFADREDDSGAERHNCLYSSEELRVWAERVKKVREQTPLTFVITNNHYEGKAVANSLQLRSMLSNRPIKVPSSMLKHYPELQSIADDSSKEEYKLLP